MHNFIARHKENQRYHFARQQDFEHIFETTDFFCGTRSTVEENTPKRSEAENFQFGHWPQASRLGSWKFSFMSRGDDRVNFSVISRRMAGRS